MEINEEVICGDVDEVVVGGIVTLSFPEISSWISFSLSFFHWL